MKGFLFGLLNAFSNTFETDYTNFNKPGEITKKINKKRLKRLSLLNKTINNQKT